MSNAPPPPRGEGEETKRTSCAPSGGWFIGIGDTVDAAFLLAAPPDVARERGSEHGV
jgi:hypothetical protein